MRKREESLGLLEGIPDIEVDFDDVQGSIDLEAFPVRYESTHLSFTRKPTAEEADGVMHALTHMHDVSPMYLGDAIIVIKNVFGEKWSQFIPKKTVSEKTLENCERICRSCPPAIRIEGLSQGHYDAATGVQPDERRAEFLQECSDEGWTIREARTRKNDWMKKGKHSPKVKANKEVIRSCVDRIVGYLADRRPVFAPEFCNAVDTLAEEVKKL